MSIFIEGPLVEMANFESFMLKRLKLWLQARKSRPKIRDIKNIKIKTGNRSESVICIGSF